MTMKNIEEKYLINEKSDFDKLARWGKTFGENHGKFPNEKGFHELCVTHMEGHIDDAPAYCARVKDVWYGSTFWRSKKTEKDIEHDTKKHQNIKISKAAKTDINK